MAAGTPRFSSLRTRLAVLYAGLFAVAMLCVSAVLYGVVERTAEGQVRRELVASGTVFDRLWQQRSDQMRDAAGLMARDFGFRSAVATHDASTIESALSNLRERLGLPMAIMVDIDGNVVGADDAAIGREARDMAMQLDNDAVGGVVSLGGAARHLVAAPIMAPALSGWVLFSVDLDDHEMHGLEQLSAIPLTATVYQRQADGRWAPGERTTKLINPAIDRFIADSGAAATPSTVDAGQGVAIALVKPLPTMPGAPPTVLLLQYPLARALAPYRPLQIAIAIVSLAGLALVVAATWRMARSITRPISQLDEAAGRIAEGDRVNVEVDSGDEIGRLAATFNRMADEISERERRIAHLAFNDVLTGLPNRALFHEQLDRELRLAERRSGGVALLCVDLDDFKLVNDTLGHPVGDTLLRQIAGRLGDLPDDVFAARLGADEFVIIQPMADEGDIEEVGALARRLIGLLQVPVRIGDHDIEPHASIGIAVSPADGQETETLLRNADLALHQAKQAGRHMIRFFEPALNARAQARRAIETDLRRALQNGELELFFQPLIDLAKRKIGSFEALIRWRHPTRGLVPPVEFIPIAEETGLIVPIGAWVVREACRQARSWGDEALRVAVNVSSIQMREPGLAQVIGQALQTSGLAPSRLEIEITESVFLDSSASTLDLLHELRAIGTRIALDDFGTGYSSLSYLQSFPFDKIKIDRSFVVALAERQGAGAIVQAIIDLAGALGMETTAEGVETQAQLTELTRRGVGSIQGYLFSKPVPAGEVAGLLASPLRVGLSESSLRA